MRFCLQLSLIKVICPLGMLTTPENCRCSLHGTSAQVCRERRMVYPGVCRELALCCFKSIKLTVQLTCHHFHLHIAAQFSPASFSPKFTSTLTFRGYFILAFRVVVGQRSGCLLNPASCCFIPQQTAALSKQMCHHLPAILSLSPTGLGLSSLLLLTGLSASTSVSPSEISILSVLFTTSTSLSPSSPLFQSLNMVSTPLSPTVCSSFFPLTFFVSSVILLDQYFVPS